ncbi:hypothetical protein ACQH8C_24315, partial [Escherichia coli]|uniref:hypothetical protein n=1 Tax=Escherichia coli TaxID=562 RepID=UPI003CE89FCD
MYLKMGGGVLLKWALWICVLRGSDHPFLPRVTRIINDILCIFSVEFGKLEVGQVHVLIIILKTYALFPVCAFLSVLIIGFENVLRFISIT